MPRINSTLLLRIITPLKVTDSALRMHTCNSYLLYSYIYSLVGTCLVLAVKYHEEHPHFNNQGYRFYLDNEFMCAVGIPPKDLRRFQIEIL